MHPIVMDQLAADHRTRLLAEAESRRRLRAFVERTRRPSWWRTVPARALVALARRLDPAALRGPDHATSRRGEPCLEGMGTAH